MAIARNQKEIRPGVLALKSCVFLSLLTSVEFCLQQRASCEFASQTENQGGAHDPAQRNEAGYSLIGLCTALKNMQRISVGGS